jgi:hypothetical protein
MQGAFSAEHHEVSLKPITKIAITYAIEIESRLLLAIVFILPITNRVLINTFPSSVYCIERPNFNALSALRADLLGFLVLFDSNAPLGASYGGHEFLLLKPNQQLFYA